ncbi:MAG: LapA family protein [Leptolyngbyaceae cyanobacterium T60_A2020_046]|nr:LapA family protein [Leptolyngbyaceae cyanobacterium T60_A2020_046]
MRLFVIAALAIAFLAILFALQNTNPVTIQLVIWDYRQSLALVLLGTLAIGVIVGLLVSIPAIIRRGWQVARLHKQTDSLTEQITAKNQDLDTSAQKIAAVRHSYQTMLDALGLIEPHTGLLPLKVLPQVLGWLLHHLLNGTGDHPVTSLSLLLFKVTPQPHDGLNLGKLWAAIAQHLHAHGSAHTWFYSDGAGLFAATVPNLDATATNRYGETLQATLLEQMPSLLQGVAVDAEISVGGAIATRDTPVDAQHLLSTAQAALDQAQQRGRNRLRFLSASV